MSLSSDIRAFITAQGRPCRPAEVAAAIPPKKAGDPKHAIKVSWAIGVMYRDGMMGRELHADGGFAYVVVRQPAQPLSREEARARRTQREIARLRRKGVRPLSEFLAELAAKKAATAKRKAVERESRRQAERERIEAARAQRAVRAPVKAVTPKPKAPPAPKEPSPKAAPAVIRLAPNPPPKPAVRVESVEEWQRRTGRKPERLHPAACAHPLKRIGWQPETKRKAA